MAPRLRAIQLTIDGVRCRRVQGPLVADNAVVSRSKAGIIMAPGTMQIDPVAGVAPRRGLVMAAHAKVLLMTGEASVPAPLSHETVGARPPGVVMVTGQLHIVTGDAVGLLVADKTGVLPVEHVYVRGPAMILKPVSRM
jgi:hypothetical protein